MLDNFSWFNIHLCWCMNTIQFQNVVGTLFKTVFICQTTSMRNVIHLSPNTSLYTSCHIEIKLNKCHSKAFPLHQYWLTIKTWINHLSYWCTVALIITIAQTHAVLLYVGVTLTVDLNTWSCDCYYTTALHF